MIDDLNKYYNDAELLELMKKSKKFADYAFLEIYKKYSKELYSFCKYYIHEKEVLEIVYQDTWLDFYKYSREKNDIKSIRALLITIAKRRYIDFLRNSKKNHKNVKSIEDLTLEEINKFLIYPNEDQSDISTLIDYGISCLPIKYREVFILNKLNGLSYYEISEVNGLTVDCVKKRIYRATIKLKKVLMPYVKEFFPEYIREKND